MESTPAKRMIRIVCAAAFLLAVCRAGSLGAAEAAPAPANETGEISGDLDWIDPAYDDAGNMISGPQPGAESARLHFTYDAWNRLVQVRADDPGNPGQPGDTIAEYQYDGANRRIAKLIPSGDDWNRTDYYYNEGWQCLEERYGEGQPKEAVPETPSVQWLWDPRYIDAPVLRWRSVSGPLDETLYYCNDANMNVTALVSASGTVEERYVYDPYGSATIYDGSWNEVQWEASKHNAVLYCGYRFDAETGFYNVRFRYYHPTLGRWMARDPGPASPRDEGQEDVSGAYSDGMNLYQYCHSTPAAGTDPSGRIFILIHGNTASGHHYGLGEMRKLTRLIASQIMGQDEVKLHDPEGKHRLWMYVKHAADANMHAGKRCSPIIIIGYSDGATRLRWLTQQLAAKYPKEKVDYVGVIDMTRSTFGRFGTKLPGGGPYVTLPSNVLDGDNFYQRHFLSPLKGMLVMSPATVFNHNWNILSTGGTSDHFNIVADAAIQNRIANSAVQAWRKAKEML